MTEERNYVLFKTDLFVYEQDDEHLDHWHVGGDCAGWFLARLLPFFPSHDAAIVMEDWGWTFDVFVDPDQVDVNVWFGPDLKNCWILGFEARSNRLFWSPKHGELQLAKQKVTDAVEKVLQSDPRIVRFQWYAEYPTDFETF